MTTTLYIRRLGRRPFHLLADDGRMAVCGAVSRADAGAGTLAVAPEPLSSVQVCKDCLLALAESHSDEGRGDEREMA